MTDQDKASMPPTPVLVGDSAAALDPAGLATLPAGAAWRLTESPRQLDANVVHLPAGQQVAAHVEPALDVLLHVLQGSGQVTTVTGSIELVPGRMLWLPRGSQRSLAAGSEGLSYLTVHVRRPGLGIGQRPPGS
jgi:quercetin dioxygenase-like cupin family protein